jgi:hypothetical protein
MISLNLHYFAILDFFPISEAIDLAIVVIVASPIALID